LKKTGGQLQQLRLQQSRGEDEEVEEHTDSGQQQQHQHQQVLRAGAAELTLQHSGSSSM